MKIILSRKGFDTSNGRIPSPIFPDGRMISLPIPFRCAPTRFREVHYSYGGNLHTIAELITILKGRRTKPAPDDLCHVDPDLRKETLENRGDYWRPSFGQDGGPQGHLRKRAVGRGDLFLFFGRFQQIKATSNGWQYQHDTTPVHALYGWLQIGADPIKVKNSNLSELLNEYSWLHGHAHLCDGYDKTVRGENVIYVASKRLNLCGVEAGGAGVFKYSDDLVLTTQGRDVRRLDIWDLSGWWGSLKNTAFSHHYKSKNLYGWDGALFNSRGPWQELVIDSNKYPKVLNWAAGLIQDHWGE